MYLGCEQYGSRVYSCTSSSAWDYSSWEIVPNHCCTAQVKVPSITLKYRNNWPVKHFCRLGFSNIWLCALCTEVRNLVCWISGLNRSSNLN